MAWSVSVTKRGAKIVSRLRAGGVVLSKSRVLKQISGDPTQTVVSSRKLRVAGLPNRKAASLKR